jgi:hypothetical protein
MIKSEKRIWEKFVMDLQEDYKGNKKLLYAVTRNKVKPKTELCHTRQKKKVGLDTRHGHGHGHGWNTHGVTKWTD